MKGLRRLYRRVRFGEPIVVVSGLPRSGTSMAMKMLQAGGMEVVEDGIRTADVDNPKGYFEHERIKDLGNETDKSWIRSARGKCIKVISYLLKDLPADNNYRIVFMRRNLEEVLASQQKMLDHRGEDNATEDDKMIDLYENHLWRVNYLFKHAAHLEHVEVVYHEVLADPADGAKKMNALLGGRLDEAKMRAVVDGALYRNRKS